ncbi:MAG: hypothetical protein GQ477_01275 [Nanohaloarchaea archaeon]|nr:hypothetical protein [Candidatus Nanohaloarchaea archaeon]
MSIVTTPQNHTVDTALKIIVETNKLRESPEDSIRHLIKPGNMKDKSLGECLNDIKWGGQTSVMYTMGISDMISFIQNWMEQNEGNFQNLFNDKETYDFFIGTTLPYTEHDVCQRNESHKGQIRDFDGNIRCAYSEIKKIRPSYINYFNFFDPFSELNIRQYYESKPLDDLPDDAWGEMGQILPEWKDQHDAYLYEIARFEDEEPTKEVRVHCHSIISDKGFTFSLETILKRLNLEPNHHKVYCNLYSGSCTRQDELNDNEKETYDLIGNCPGHIQPTQRLILGIDSYSLAHKIQLWYEQVPDGQAPLFE